VTYSRMRCASLVRSAAWITSTFLIVASLSACAHSPSSDQRIILATEHIENPIRALEARAELETLDPMTRASDELLGLIIPDMATALDVGSPAYQRAMRDPTAIDADAHSPFDADERLEERIDPQHRSQAIKLYTRARALRQTGAFSQAISVLEQAAQLDPGSSSIQRELGDALIVADDRAGAIAAFERAIELGDRSPRAMIHLAAQASLQDDSRRVIWLTSQALRDRSVRNHPLARSIARVLLGAAEIDSGYLKAGAQTLGDALDSFNTRSRDLRWKHEIIQIMSRRSQLWLAVGDAWASIGAQSRAQEAYTNAAMGVEHPPIALVARQIAWALREGQPARASLIFLDHLQRSASNLGNEERQWARALASFDGIGDVLGPAIAELAKRPGLTASIRRSLLSIELEALDTNHAIARLGSAGLDAKDSTLCLRILHRIEDDDKRFAAALTILETNPGISKAIASGMIRTLNHPVQFMHGHANPRSATQELLIAAMGIGLGRADLIEHLDAVELNRITQESVDWLSTHAQGFALRGQWAQANRLTDELHSRLTRSHLTDDDWTLARRLASSLLIAQQPDASWKLASELADDADAEIEDLLLGAQIAQVLQKYEPAATFLERALELDPYNESIYEQLFVLRSASSPIGDESELQYVVRQLGTTLPHSGFFGLLRANELARNGLVSQAESLLVELNNQHLDREIGYDLLMSIWKTQSTQGQVQALSLGIEWLEGRLASDPNSTQGMLAVAQGLYELDAHQRAMDLLTKGYARTGSFELARAIEQLLAGVLEEPEAADAHLIARLKDFKGIDPTLEYAQFLAKKPESVGTQPLAALLDANLPMGIALLPAQRLQLDQVIFTLTRSVEALDNALQLLDIISILESRSLPLSLDLVRVKVLLLAQLPRLDLEELVRVIHQGDNQAKSDQERSTLRSLPIRSLLGEGRVHEAIALTARLAISTGQIDTRTALDTYQLLATQGTNTDMIGVLDLLDAHGLMEQMIELITIELGTPSRNQPALTPDQQRADLIYIAAVYASAFDRPAQAQSYYELALSYDPDHAWSNNDYGYMLAEAGERINYATELLERAADALPNEASVIDSLAWVRYKMGIFEDIPGQDGQPHTPGAISLLIRANELDTDRENATIMLHLGDALWRGGYQDRAIDAWRQAEDIARHRLESINAQPNPNQRAIDAISTELEEILHRINEAQSTGEPAIAPLVDEPKSDEKTGSDEPTIIEVHA